MNVCDCVYMYARCYIHAKFALTSCKSLYTLAGQTDRQTPVYDPILGILQDRQTDRHQYMN